MKLRDLLAILERLATIEGAPDLPVKINIRDYTEDDIPEYGTEADNVSICCDTDGLNAVYLEGCILPRQRGQS